MRYEGSRRPGAAAVRSSALLAGLALFAVGAGCSSSGDGGGNEAVQSFEFTSFAGKATNVPLASGALQKIVGTYQTPKVPGPLALNALTVDVGATLGSVTLTKPGSQKATPAFGFAAPDSPLVEVTLFVAPATDEATVCDTGIAYGPYTITQSGLTSVDSLEADQATLSIINTGSVAICVAMLPHQDRTLNVARVAVTATTCEVGAEDIAGIWSGTYACNNSPCDDDGGDITLTITQAPGSHSAHYADSEAEYDGTVCGGVFRFNGAGPGYTEKGTFIRQSDGTATKSSRWVSDDFACSGTCSDTLARIGQP